MQFDLPTMIDSLASGYTSALAWAKNLIAQNQVLGYVLLVLVALLMILTFASQCRLLHKAGIGWGWNFCPIIRDYAHTKMVHISFAFWFILLVSLLSAVLIQLSGLSFAYSAEGNLIILDSAKNILYDAANETLLAEGFKVPVTFTVGAAFMGLAMLMALIYYVVYCVRLAFSFGHGAFFSVGILILPEIFLPILAFGKSEYTAIY